ncbi:hypothetical protein EVC13_028 [Rhizobium phage RHph_I65]|nr:hypothetical protein EVC13_028 [Rhizobium phage RHph_I65]
MTEYSDKQKAYIKKLRGVDWWACMSDDGGVARRGEAHERAVRAEGEADPDLKGMYGRYRDWVLKKVPEDPFAEVK